MNKHTEHKDKLENDTLKIDLEKNRKKEIEIGGPTGPEPTRYGDWEKKGRCIDF